MCFAVPEKEVEAVSAALHTRFREALDAGRLSQVSTLILLDLWLLLLVVRIACLSFLYDSYELGQIIH